MVATNMKLIHSLGLSLLAACFGHAFTLLDQTPLHSDKFDQLRNIGSAPNQQPPIANPCPGHSFPDIVCIHGYGAVLADGFERPVRNVLADADRYPDTEVPQDESFGRVRDASFVIFDVTRGLSILGSEPRVDFMWDIGPQPAEGPVYVPETNELIFARIHHHYLPQMYINLTANPPILSEKLADPPLYTPTGARYRNGKVYFATIGGASDLGGRTYRPGIYTMDPRTRKTTPLLNNYYGYFFNGIDDLDVDAHGVVYFSDNYYGRSCGVNGHAPALPTGTYRFDPASGHVALVEDTLEQPNGVQLSPDGQTLYLTDTGAGGTVIDPEIPADEVGPIRVNSTGPRAVYAFDLVRPSPGEAGRTRLRNRDVIHMSMDYAPDGIKVASDGTILTGAGHGISILSPDGALLMRVQTNFTVINLAWAGTEASELWAFGPHGVARVRLGGLRGLRPGAPGS